MSAHLDAADALHSGIARNPETLLVEPWGLARGTSRTPRSRRPSLMMSQDGRRAEKVSAEKVSGAVSGTCQEPIVCFGRPRGRRVEPRANRRTMSSSHDAAPNGRPRWVDARSTSSSAAVSARLTDQRQSSDVRSASPRAAPARGRARVATGCPNATPRRGGRDPRAADCARRSGTRSAGARRPRPGTPCSGPGRGGRPRVPRRACQPGCALSVSQLMKRPRSPSASGQRTRCQWLGIRH